VATVIGLSNDRSAFVPYLLGTDLRITSEKR
jgi:hypothetical protein